MRSKIVLFADLFLFLVTAFVTLAIVHNQELTSTHVIKLLPYVLFGLLTAAFSFLTMGTNRGLWHLVSFADTIRIITSVALAIAVTMLFIFFFNRLDGVSRTQPLLHFPLLVASMLGARHFVRRFGPRGTRNTSQQLKPASTDKESVLIVGLSHVTELYMQCVRSMAADRIHVEGILEEDTSMHGRLLQFTKVLGRPQDLASLLSMFNVHGVKIDRVVIAVPFAELSDESRDVLLRYEKSGTIRLDMFEERLGFRSETKATSSDAALAPAPAIERSLAGQGFVDRHYVSLKRLMDIVGASVLLIAALPVIFIVALLVAYDVGAPVIFWQERPGKRGKAFRVLKFRTMRNGHDRLGNLIPEEQRTSRIGHILRRARLDELPQLYHILIGEMSFVGPRPLLKKFQPVDRGTRLSVRPGVTGWAQVNGGNLLSAEEKNVLDIWYLRHASLWLDVKIIFRTLQVAIAGSGDCVCDRSRAAIRMAVSEVTRLSIDETPLRVVPEQELPGENRAQPGNNAAA